MSEARRLYWKGER